MNRSNGRYNTSVTFREKHVETLSVLGQIDDRTASSQIRRLIEAERERRAEEIAAFLAANPKITQAA